MRSPHWSRKILKEETVTSTNDRLAELCQEKEIKTVVSNSHTVFDFS